MRAKGVGTTIRTMKPLNQRSHYGTSACKILSQNDHSGLFSSGPLDSGRLEAGTKLPQFHRMMPVEAVLSLGTQTHFSKVLRREIVREVIPISILPN